MAITELKVAASPGGYATTITGNGGEEELVICASGGQDGRYALSILAMSVDGGGTLLYNAGGLPRPHAVYAGALEDTLRSIITAWATSGLDADGDQAGEIEEAILDVLKRVQGE